MLYRCRGRCSKRSENVALYERLGVKVVSEEAIPQVDLQNWGMVRR